LNNQRNAPVCEQPAGQAEPREASAPAAEQKKQFVEPVVSAPVDVLEATAYFLQAPTLQGTQTGT
jgi:hypothetical protein